MRRLLFWIAPLLACIAAVSCSSSKTDQTGGSEVAPSAAAVTAPGPIDPPVTNCNVTPPNTSITPALLTGTLPCAVTLLPPFDNLPNLQHGFDFYSWLTFLALNAPAGGGSIGPDSPAIWEQWKSLGDVMLPNGATPTPWGQPSPLPPQCVTPANGGHPMVLSMISKDPNILTESIQPFDSGPLIDQNGQYVHYAIMMNRPMFEYIVQHQIFNQQGQAAFGAATFPGGSATKDTTNGNIGGMLVKAAWKILDPQKDNASLFHTAHALVYQPAVTNPSPGNQPVDASCKAATVGLVGIHIVHKTVNEPQWVWSTFEHVNNVPTQAAVSAKKLAASYLFFDPACPAAKCPVNVQPPRPWNPDLVPFPNNFKSQIVRTAAITAEVNTLNTGFGGILANSVWNNYMLVSTQWPTNATSKTDPTGRPAPTFLANTTMETYVQGVTPNSSSSCIGCHNRATDTQGRQSDFTYVLQSAQKKQ
jgi:hypothetical protein